MTNSRNLMSLSPDGQRRRDAILEKTLVEANTIRQARYKHRIVGVTVAILGLIFGGFWLTFRSSQTRREIVRNEPVAKHESIVNEPDSSAENDLQHIMVFEPSDEPVVEWVRLDQKPSPSRIEFELLDDDQLLAHLAAFKGPHSLVRTGDRIWLVPHSTRNW